MNNINDPFNPNFLNSFNTEFNIEQDINNNEFFSDNDILEELWDQVWNPPSSTELLQPLEEIKNDININHIKEITNSIDNREKDNAIEKIHPIQQTILQTNQESNPLLNPKKRRIESETNNENNFRPNKKIKINNNRIGTDFIKIISNFKSQTLPQIQSILEIWRKQFSLLPNKEKVTTLVAMEKKRTFDLLDNSDPKIILVAQCLYSCFLETFFEIGTSTIYGRAAMPIYIEKFSELLLNSGWLESIVHELLSQIHHPCIYNFKTSYDFIKSFLSSNPQEWKHKEYKDFTWQLTSIVYAYFIYSYQSFFSQSQGQLPIKQTTNLLNRANQIMQRLESEKNQDENKAQWLAFLQAAKENCNPIKPTNDELNNESKDKLDEQKDSTFPSETHQEQVIQNQVMDENLQFNKGDTVSTISNHFIKIISDFQEIQTSLVLWRENFSRLNCEEKVKILEAIGLNINFYNNSDPILTLAVQNLYSCFKEIFLTLGKFSQNETPTYLETFSELLLNSGWLEPIVYELLSQIHDPSIYNFLQSFLSFNVQKCKDRYKDISWQSTSIVYAYLAYSYPSFFSQNQGQLSIDPTTPLNQANQIMQQLELEKNQDEKKARWFSFLQAAKEKCNPTKPTNDELNNELNDKLKDKLDEQKDSIQPNSTPYSNIINNRSAFPIEILDLGQHSPSLPQEQVVQNQVMDENLKLSNDYKQNPNGARFIKIISSSLNLQEMQSTLTLWKESFSKLSCQQKVKALKTIEIERKFTFFDNNSDPIITLAVQHLYSCFKETFLTFGNIKKDRNNRPAYIENFSKLLLNSGLLESIVHELLSQIHDPSIYNFLQSFLSSNIQKEWKHRRHKDFTWQSTSIVYAYLVYSHQNFFAENHEKSLIDQTTLLNRANQTMQQLKQQLESEKNQNKKKARWFSLLKTAQERYVEKEKRINQIMQELEKDPDYLLIFKRVKERYDLIVNK